MTVSRIVSTHLLRNVALIFTALALLLAVSPANAAPRKKKVAAEAPAKLEGGLRLSPKKLKFGMSPKEVSRVYRKVIDKDYVKRYQTTEPGVQMHHLDHEVNEKKRNFARSFVEFIGLGSKFDNTPLRAEYTYNNHEALMLLKRKGRTRYFFFINRKLYKTIDVYPNAGKWGDFTAASTKLDAKLTVEGRALAPDASVGRERAERDWATKKIHLRLIWWSKFEVALAYVDRVVEARLPELRKDRRRTKEKLDADVEEIIR